MRDARPARGRYGGDPGERRSSPTRGPSGSTASRREPTAQTDAHEEHPLKADAFAQLKLLDVQELDARIDQLRHRLREPARDAGARRAGRRARRGRRTRPATRRSRSTTSPASRSKADADVEQVKTRRVRDQERMDARPDHQPQGPRAACSSELVSLAPPHQRARGHRARGDGAARVRRRPSRRALHARLAEIDARAAALTESRDAKASARPTGRWPPSTGRAHGHRARACPADLLALYEKIRAQKGGVGAAALRAARECTGCSLDLNAADLGAIAKAPPDEVLRCEECNRILVRTAESGV